MSYHSLTLSPKEITKSIRQSKMVLSAYWVDGPMVGVVLTLLSWTGLVMHFDGDPSLRSTSWPLLLLAVLIPIGALRGSWRQRRLTKVETGLPLHYNRQLMLAVFRQLEWYVPHGRARQLLAQLPHSRFAIHGQLVCVLLVPNAIYINSSHYGTGRGKLPFPFVPNELALEQVLREIQTQLLLTWLT